MNFPGDAAAITGGSSLVDTAGELAPGPAKPAKPVKPVKFVNFAQLKFSQDAVGIPVREPPSPEPGTSAIAAGTGRQW